MDNNFVIDTLAESFEEEISNKVKKKNNELIIYFANGNKAKIKAISLFELH